MAFVGALVLLIAVLGGGQALNPALRHRLWGVNIHSTSAMPGEMEQLAQGFATTRMDFVWASIERQRGVYDFSAYDVLLTQLQGQKVAAYWILDYGNPLYTPGSFVSLLRPLSRWPPVDLLEV